MIDKGGSTKSTKTTSSTWISAKDAPRTTSNFKWPFRTPKPKTTKPSSTWQSARDLPRNVTPPKPVTSVVDALKRAFTVKPGVSFTQGQTAKDRIDVQQNKPKPIAQPPRLTGGQFSGVSLQANQLYQQQVSFNASDPESWYKLGSRRAKAESDVHFGIQQFHMINARDDDEHKRLVNQGEEWINGKSITDYIYNGIDLDNLDGHEFTEEEISEIERRYEEYMDYMERYYILRPFYNSETDKFEDHYCIRSDAPLPPWVKQSPQSINEWNYYKGFQSTTGDILRDQATALYEERERYKETPYKSAFNLSGDVQKTGTVDSLADVIYKTVGSDTKGWDKAKFFLNTYKQYYDDYHRNVFQSGKFGTLIGNKLWALMDDMDFAARGVRAFVAGDKYLGGTHHAIEGQNAFWISLEGNGDYASHYAQDLFVKNGGNDLFNYSAREGGFDDLSRNDANKQEQIKRKLQEAFDNDPEMRKYNISWEQVYEAVKNQYYGRDTIDAYKQGWENVKKTYTDPTKAFNADTGSVAGDIVTETILDPGLIIGGLSKGVAKGASRNITEVALRDVLKGVGNMADGEVDDILRNKAVKKAIRAFAGADEGRNVIFKNSKKIGAEADILADILHKQNIIDEASKGLFSRGMLNALTGAKHSINGKVIGAQAFDEIKNTSKLVKMASYTDKAIDTIDMAIIKGTFIEPLMLFKGAKGANKFGRYILRGVLGKHARQVDETVQAVVDTARSTGAIGKLSELIDNVNVNNLAQEEVEQQIKAVKNQFASAASLLEDVNRRLPDMSPDDVLREIDEILATVSGAGDNAMKDIDAVMKTLNSKYNLNGEFDDVLDSLKRAYSDVVDGFQRQDTLFKKEFFKEVREARSADDLAVIINKYSDKFNIHDMRAGILDNIVDQKLIPVEQLDEIFAQLDEGLLFERSATIEALRQAEGAISDVVTKVEKRTIDNVASLGSAMQKYKKLTQALDNTQQYPFLRKLSVLTDGSLNGNKPLSEQSILKHIEDAQVALAEASTIGHIYDKKEVEGISKELIELKGVIEKQLDIKGKEVVTQMHLDKQVKFDTLINDIRFSKVFDTLYDKTFKAAVDLLDTKIMQGMDAFGNSKIYTSLMKLSNAKYSYNRYRRWWSQINSMDISDEAKYAIRNGFFGSYGESGKTLVEVTRRPGKVRRYLETMIYNEFGSSKVGIDALTARMNTLDDLTPDELIADYVDDIKGNPDIYKWWKEIMDGNPADPEVYLKKQILGDVLMDSSAVAKYNAYENAPIFTHISTSGLSDDSVITGISYYKWKKIEVGEDGKPTIESLYNALRGDDGVKSIRRTMSDYEIDALDENFLRSVFKDSIGTRTLSLDDLRSEYKAVFGAVDGVSVNTESDILEQFFDSIYGSTYKTVNGLLGNRGIETTIPTFVVHDLDGFNIPFINRRAGVLANKGSTPRMFDYLNRVSSRAENASINTFDDLRKLANDHMPSDEEFREIEESVKRFAEDMSTNVGDDFSMFNISDVPSEMRTIMDELNAVPSSPEEDDVVKLLRQSMNSDEAGRMLDDADNVAKDIAVLEEEAYQIVAVKNARPADVRGPNASYQLNQAFANAWYNRNPVRSGAEELGSRILNVADRYDLHRVSRYFSLGDITTGVKTSFRNIERMSNVARYIDEKIRYSIRMGAEEYLTPFKARLDDTLEAMRNMALASPNTDGYFTWLRGLEVPQSATESYLMVQKLYDDFLKYWLNNDLAADYAKYQSVHMVTDALGSNVRERLLAEFVDQLNFSGIRDTVNDFDEILDLLEGSGHSIIFKDVPIEYISKMDVYTSKGKVKDGVDLARKLKRAYNQMKSSAREHQYLDTILRSVGINTKTEFELGLMFTHTEELLRLADNNGLIGRAEVQTALESISNAHVIRFHNTRLQRLKNADGVISEHNLISELIYNGQNHILFQKKYYKDGDIKALKKVVEDLNSNGHNYFKIAEDRGAIGVYLDNTCEVVNVMEDGVEQRFIHDIVNDTYGGRYIKPEFKSIGLPTIDELKEIGVGEDLGDDFWEMYSKLRECWDDVGILSEGASNGTLGRVAFDYDVDEYYKLADRFMPDLLSSKGMRDAHMYGRTVYDPGFMLPGDYDIFTDFLHTMETQSESFKASGTLLNNVFGSGNEFNFGELMRYVSDKEASEFFGESSDFVVCTIIPDSKTKLGVRVKQLKFSGASDVANAKTLGNTVVLPYDMYLEMTDAINVAAHTSDLNRAINKMMLVYKAGALFHPGTWVRNFIDATQKSTTDLGGSPLSIFDTFAYELKCMQDINKFHKALKYGDDFLTEANWDVVQRTLGTDMTYENFELLRGMFDSDRYVSKAQTVLSHNRRANGGREILSGDKLGLNNLSEKDILKAYKSTSKKVNNLMDQKRFLELYLDKAKALDDIESRNYDDTMRAISNYMHNSKAIASFSNTVSASFIPFNLGEMTVRYAQLSRLNDLGFSNNQALKRVHLTQFRQAERYGITNRLEYIVPFITFKYNNLKYWMRMMEENPTYFRYFEKLYGNIYEDTIEQYQEKGEELDFGSSWMLKSGGLPIGNGQYYFKLNPSFMDTLQTLYGFPSEAISFQNPLLRLATRASMYELGLDGKYLFQELNLNPDDVNVNAETILKTVAPQAYQLWALRKMDVDKFRTWANGIGPDMNTLHQLIPSLIGKNFYDGYAGATFEEYQQSLEDQGLWFDCNTGQVVSILYKNEMGMNAPELHDYENSNHWMDFNNYMMQHFNKTWDANKGKFVMFWELTEGGLNQVFDFENDPTAWDRLCEEWAKRGKKWDANTKKFIPVEQWRADGLNNPNLSWEEKVELMAEKFPELKWDANRNTFVTAENFIEGGLNREFNFGKGNWGDWRELQMYRYILFGESYDKESKEFVKNADPKVAILSDLYPDMNKYDKYYAMLGIPQLMETSTPIKMDGEGFLITEDGKYVLTDNAAYNAKVFDKMKDEVSPLFPSYSGYGRGRSYHRWKRYSYNKTRKPKKVSSYTPKIYQTGYGWNEEEGYYRLEYSYSYQYHNPQPSSRTHRLITPPRLYPFGGGYNKYSFHSRF